jgi:acetyl esterase/lipase
MSKTGRSALDPLLFRPEAIDPETESVNKVVEALLATMPSIVDQTPQEIRAEREAGKGVFPPLLFLPEARDRFIPGPAGPIKLRVCVADKVECVYLHFHGGGWVLGGAHHQDPLLKLVADTCNAAVISVDYRLAPEHPYPAGPDDCEAAAVWLVKNSVSEFGTDRLMIGGESAGAHLSAVTLVRLRDKHGFTDFRAANLVFGAFDLSLTPSVRRWGDRNLILSTPIIEWFTNHFVPPDRRRDPDVSPLYADLCDMPPALFTIGTLDPLLDDNLFMHDRWVAAGNTAELAVYPGCIHGFTAFPNQAGRDGNLGQLDFLQRWRG